MKSNADIRKIANRAKVYLWQIGDRMGLTDSNFSRKMRKELSIEEKVKILSIIAGIQSERRQVK